MSLVNSTAWKWSPMTFLRISGHGARASWVTAPPMCRLFRTLSIRRQVSIWALNRAQWADAMRNFYQGAT